MCCYLLLNAVRAVWQLFLGTPTPVGAQPPACFSTGAAVSQSRDLAPPSGIRPCFVLQTYCLMGKKSVFLLARYLYCNALLGPTLLSTDPKEF